MFPGVGSTHAPRNLPAGGAARRGRHGRGPRAGIARDRKVAIKTLPDRTACAARLRPEALAMASITIPNLAVITASKRGGGLPS